MSEESVFDERGKEAETIVNNYGASLAVESEGFARPVSLLKNSKEEIKKAIKDYIVALISVNRLSKEITSVLSFGYASVELFTDDEKAAYINKLQEQNKTEALSEEEYNIYHDHVQSTTLAMKQNVEEITQFLQINIGGR